MSWLYEMLMPGFLYDVGDGGGGGGGAAEPVEPVEPVVAAPAVDIAKQIADGIAAGVAQAMADRPAPVAAAVVAEPVVDPYDQAAAEARDAGTDYDKDWINKRALQIQNARHEAQRTADRQESAAAIGAATVDSDLVKLVGDDPNAQEYARKFILKAKGRVTDPDLIDLLKRGAKDYAAEKKLTSTTLNRIEGAPGEGGPIVLSREGRQEMTEINDILASVNPAAQLTEKDLQGTR